MNLYQYLDFAPVIAFEWLASDDELHQVSAYHILSRLFMNGREPNERGINELLDQALTALEGENPHVRHAAGNCLQRLAQLGPEYEALVDSGLKTLSRS